MISSRIKETTSTTGTGTMTLAGAVDGFITFTQGGALDGEAVPYMVIDGDDWEEGIGIYTLSGTTLARTRIDATLVSGTFTDVGATAITLTSGSKDVFIGDTRNNYMPPLTNFSALNNTTKEVTTPGSANKVFQNRTTAVSWVFYSEFYMPGRVVLEELGMEIKVISASGGDAQLGIYEQGGVGQTWHLIDQTSVITIDGTIGKKTGSLIGGDLPLNPGMYVIAYGSDGDATLEGVNGDEGAFLPALDYKNISNGFFTTSGYSAGLPSSTTFDHNNSQTGVGPLLWGVHA